jgi:dienelactone hydrolase
MEYLPAGYNNPANSAKKYPLVIYTPGCGETHNGVFYKHLDNTPNYYYGTGRLFVQGNPPIPNQRWNIGGAQQSYPVLGGSEVWAADLTYKDTLNSGIASTQVSTGNTISGTTRPELYQTSREGAGFTYSIPMFKTIDNIYRVKLYFAETNPAVTAIGQRVFDVKVEGNSLDNLDIYKEAGNQRNTAVVKEFNNVGVYDGMLNITFTSDVGLASVSAIEVYQYVGSDFASLPKYIRDGGDYFSQVPVKTIGQAYTSGGPTQGMIILCLVPRGDPSVCQGSSYAPDVKDIDDALTMAFRNYRIDASKVYLTGMSQGSTVCFTYPGASLDRAQKIAAVGPVAAPKAFVYFEPGADQRITNLVQGGVSMLAVTNKYDINNFGINIQDLNVRAVQDVKNKVAELGTLNKAIHYYFAETWQNPASPSPTHDGWQYAYRGFYESWDNTSRVFEDPLPGGAVERYSLFEWFLLQSNAAALPVTLNSFTATRTSSSTVSVDWSTSSESNSRDFTLERSTDGLNFKDLATLPAAGNSSTLKKYNYLDQALPASQYVYYRLRQTDKDGKFKIYGIRRVFIGDKGFEIKAYPTLTTGSLTLEIQGVSSDPINLRIVDLSGKLLLQRVVAPRQNRVDLDVSHLAKGMYFIQASNPVYTNTTKFIKQ